MKPINFPPASDTKFWDGYYLGYCQAVKDYGDALMKQAHDRPSMVNVMNLTSAVEGPLKRTIHEWNDERNA